MRSSFAVRCWLLSACLAAAGGLLTRQAGAAALPPRAPFASFPMSVEGWTSAGDDEIDRRVLDVLRLDEYVNRTYRLSPDGPPVGLFIAYYASQREGQSMHSPLNCLPGAGWQSIASGRERIPLAVNGRPTTVDVNRHVVEKNGQRVLVLYWYAGQGRVVASEYWGKAYTVVDAIRTGRTDAALVRVIVPFRSSSTDPREALTAATAFARAIVPRLSPHLPA